MVAKLTTGKALATLRTSRPSWTALLEELGLSIALSEHQNMDYNVYAATSPHDPTSLLRPMWASRGVPTPLYGRWASRLRRCSSLPQVRGGQLQRHRAHAHEVLNMLYLVGAAAALPGDRRQQLHDEVDAGHVNDYRYSL